MPLISDDSDENAGANASAEEEALTDVVNDLDDEEHEVMMKDSGKVDDAKKDEEEW